MPNSTPGFLENLGKLRRDFIGYAPVCLSIKTKSGALVPFELNKAQLYIHERLQEQLASTGKVRALILKGRQQGASTYIGGRFYWRASLNRGVKVYILTHEQPATDNLFGMVSRYHEHSPLKPHTGAANAKELVFDRLDSGYVVATAGTKAGGRSSTIQLFHGSEVAFWPNAPLHFAGVVQAVPDLPGTEIILESTANGVGGEFHRRCKEAMAGIGDYQLIFVPWFWQDEYTRPVPADFKLDEEELEYFDLHASNGCSLPHMVWRRAKVHELGALLFKQEYPATADEAFQTTGHDSFIKPESVLRARRANIVGVGPLVIGVDPKREGKDRFAIAWRKGRRLLKVESDASPTDTIRSATKLKQIIDGESPAAVFIDVGGNGGAIYDVLASWGDRYKRIVKLVNFGAAPIHPPKLDLEGKPMAGPRNRRAEMWSLSRDWLEDEGGADIPDLDSLQADATAPGYRYHPVTSQLLLESKEDIAARGLPSPDEWDAIALTFAEPVTDVSGRAPLKIPNVGIV